MRTLRLFTPEALKIDNRVCLDKSAVHYLHRVLRASVGQPLVLFNGQGGEHSGLIDKLTKHDAEILIRDFRAEQRESNLQIHLGIGLSRGDKMDWIVQKATELGVAKITPLFTERTEVKLSGDRLDKRQQHWQQVAISACEQCQRNLVPIVGSAEPIGLWIDRTIATSKVVLHHRSVRTLTELSSPNGDLTLLIGPEGGLSDAEISLAEKKDFQAVRLGPRVLRTETAPLAAISIAQALWGDMS